MRALSLPGNAPPQLLVIAPGPGMLLAHSWTSLALHAYTINGRHIATAEGTERLSALAVSADGRFVLSGGAKGVITLRWLHSLQVRLLNVSHRLCKGHLQAVCKRFLVPKWKLPVYVFKVAEIMARLADVANTENIDLHFNAITVVLHLHLIEHDDDCHSICAMSQCMV